MTTDDGHLKRLEEDFNGGDPLDLQDFKTILEQASPLGFATADVIEAALVLGTTKSLQELTDYLLASTKEKKIQYEKAKEKASKEIKIPPEKQKLIDEIRRLKNYILQEKQKQQQLEDELKERKNVKKLDKYSEFLRGIVADEIITQREQAALNAYKHVHQIDDEMHKKALEMLEMSQEELEDYSKKKDDQGSKKCVLCKNGPKECVIIPCMHVCICEKCKDKLNIGGPGDGCPICGGDIKSVETVYMN